MRGAILPLPNTPSWHCAQLKHRDNFTLPAGHLPDYTGSCPQDVHFLAYLTRFSELYIEMGDMCKR
jgi:hypothetical protein